MMIFLYSLFMNFAHGFYCFFSHNKHINARSHSRACSCSGGVNAAHVGLRHNRHLSVPQKRWRRNTTCFQWGDSWVMIKAWIMRVTASCEGFPTLQRKWGGSGRSGGVPRHCPRRAETRSSRSTRSSSPSHCQSNNTTLQLLLRQHAPVNPPKSPLILFIQPTPPCDPPPPTSTLDTGSGDMVFVSHSRVKTRWVCSATVFNKSEHIYGTKSSARSSFTAIFRSE